MILLLSSSDDGFTSLVSEWLDFYRKEYIVLFSDDERVKIVSWNIDKNEFLLQKGGKTYNLFETTSILNRRKGFSIKSINVHEKLNNNVFFDENDSYHIWHRNQELTCLIDYIHFKLNENGRFIIGNFKKNNVNKLEILELAKRNGLNIPESYILTKKADLLKLIKYKETENKNIITKPLSQGVYRILPDIGYYNYVERLSPSNLKHIPNTFFPSLFQIEIKKKYELRIFYLNGDCYTMAIFSQGNRNTETDFRKPNLDKPDNRKVPYNLPKDILNKIVTLMNQIELNTGSIDMILDQDDRYVFLEVNPIGQISMTSYPCNYYLEQFVAQQLILHS